MAKLRFGNGRSPFAAMITVTALVCCLAACVHADEDSASANNDPINMTIKDAPVAEVLTMLSEASGINIVVGQDVTGSIGGLNLRGVTVEQALRNVARSAGLYWYKEDNAYIVTAKQLPGGVLMGPMGVKVALGSEGPLVAPAVPANIRRPAGTSSAAPPAGPSVPSARRAGSGPRVATEGAAIASTAAQPRAEAPVSPVMRIAPTAPVSPAVPPTALRTAYPAPAGTGAKGARPQVPAVAHGNRVNTDSPRSAVISARPALSAPVQPTGLAPVARGAGAAVRGTPTRAVPAPVAPAAATARKPAAVPSTVSSAGAAGEPAAGAEAPGGVAREPRQRDGATQLAHATGVDERALAAPAAPVTAPGEHARAAAGGEKLVEATVPARGMGEEPITTMLPVMHADPAELALLLGGTVSQAAQTHDGKYQGGRRGWRDRRNRSDVFGAMEGAGGSDRYWMQQLDLGGGLGRGLGTSGGSRSGRGGGMGGSQRGGQRGQGTGMRPEGVDSIIAYMPQNALLVSGEPAAIDQLREVLALLDQPVKQVEISTKFIEVDVTDDDALGIDWTVSNGSLEFFNLGFAPGEAVNNVVRWARGKFEATLAVLKNRNKGTIVNEPHVTTQNNVFAYLSFYTTIPYWTATITYNNFGQRQVDYEEEEVDVEQTLEVMPRINADDTITMYLTPIMEDQGPDVIGPNGERVPIVMTQEIETQVTVADGETIVLGGMIRKRQTLNQRFTPLLSEIPIIGKLFQSKIRHSENTELLIFVTPRIIRDIPAP